jgi:hypothetical protein
LYYVPGTAWPIFKSVVHVNSMLQRCCCDVDFTASTSPAQTRNAPGVRTGASMS